MDICQAWNTADTDARIQVLALANYSEKRIEKYHMTKWLDLPFRTRYRIMEADYRHRQLDCFSKGKIP